MSARRVVLSSFVLVALARSTCVVADDHSDKAVLGPAVPIGNLLILRAGFDDEPELLPPAPIPLLPTKLISAPPAAWPDAPSIAPAHSGMMRVTALISPGEEIPFHLTQAILGMRVAGLNDEAEQAASLLKEFQTKHQARLLLAVKQAQLSELQAEVHRLKLRVEKGITADQVSVSIKIIEVNDSDTRKLLTANPRAALIGEPTKLSTQLKTFSRLEFQELMAQLQHLSGVRLLSQPTLRVLSGQKGEVTTGSKFPITGIIPVGLQSEILYGMTVTATPTITDKDEVRVLMTVESSEHNMVHRVPFFNILLPYHIRRSTQSTLDLKDGQTTIIGGFVSSKNEQVTEMFIAVTAEIVDPINEIADPLTQPIRSSYDPTPTPPRPLK